MQVFEDSDRRLEGYDVKGIDSIKRRIQFKKGITVCLKYLWPPKLKIGSQNPSVVSIDAQ